MAEVELMGAAEVATFLGVSRQRVHQLRETYRDFPEPLSVLATGPVWDGRRVRAWQQKHPDRPTGIRLNRSQGSAS
jgi:predicted DNA-binding transcriptional regulator AlpA